MGQVRSMDWLDNVVFAGPRCGGPYISVQEFDRMNRGGITPHVDIQCPDCGAFGIADDWHTGDAGGKCCPHCGEYRGRRIGGN